MNILTWILDFNFKIPTPAILKPKPLWSGKQIISMILPDLSFIKLGSNSLHTRTSVDQYFQTDDMSIIIRDGQLLCGRLNKSMIGAVGGHTIGF